MEDHAEVRYWLTPEYRDKYNDDDRQKMAKSGEAMPDGSYPIADEEDLNNAIQAVGRGNADHDAIRKHIIARAHALGHADAIPDNWNADGSLKQENSRDSEIIAPQRTAASIATERRKERHRAVPLQREVRFFAPQNIECRRESRDDTDVLIISGAPIVYGVPYTVVDFFGEFRETMHYGSVTSLLPHADVRFLLNHEGIAMGRTKSGTLRLWDTPQQLNFEVRLDARMQCANDFYYATERGDMSQMSIGMIVDDDKWGWDAGAGVETRDIYGLNELMDVSGVTFPCSPTTHMEVAQRMVMATPLESRARLRRMAVELRAGKVLSADSQTKLLAALDALHDLASAGGVEGYGPDADEGETELQTHSDGTEEDTGNIESDAGITYPDGTGGRAAEDTAEHTDVTMTASTLRLLVEAGRPKAD